LVVEANEVEHRAEDQVRKFRDDKASHECNPRVHAGLLLASVVDVTAFNEKGLELSNGTGGNEDEVEPELVSTCKNWVMSIRVTDRAKSFNCNSPIDSPIFQNEKPLKRADPMCSASLLLT
jgi:hypothetical protein